MSLTFHEIAEANHRIQNPIAEDRLMLLGEICRLQPGMRLLDLGCGKGEMLCRWAQTYGIEGIGVDISAVFLDAAHRRAAELGVSDKLVFIQADAAHYRAEARAFDVVSCIGATWIGDGTVGTIKLLLPALKPHGLLLIGEPYWIEEPPTHVYDALGIRRTDYTTLVGYLDRFKAAETELVEMVLANSDSWDRYEASQWMTVHDYLLAHPDDPNADNLREWIHRQRECYLAYGRRYLGWGVFVLRPMS